MKLSVVIPCYNAAGTIGAQLEALAGQVWAERWEIVVADNGSTDGSLAVVQAYQRWLGNLRIVDASGKRGGPHALNIGIGAAVGQSVAICDADDEVAPGWVAAMGRALGQYDFVGCRTEVARFNSASIRKAQGNPQGEGLQTLWYAPYCLYAGSGTMGVKRALWESVGGFDESLPYVYDTDFCIRLQLAGTKLHFVPDAVVHLRYRSTQRGIFRQSRNWAKYNILVAKRYRSSPLPIVRCWKRYGTGWLHVVAASGRILDEGERVKWLWHLGWQVGRLAGSVIYLSIPI